MKRSIGLCYVIPRYEEDQTEHFAHLPALLNRLGSRIPLAVLVEKGTRPAGLDQVRHVVVLKHGGSGPIRRGIELALAARRLAKAGYRTFFLRYSRFATTTLLLLPRWLGIRVMYWASGQADMVTDRSLSKRFERRFNSAHFRWLVRRIDTFVTGPESIVSYMTDRWSIDPGKVRLLYNDIDTTRFLPADARQRSALRVERGWDPEEFVILFVHRIAPRRGSRLLVPLVERLRAELAGPFRLVVIGDGPDAAHVARQHRESPARDHVDIVGPVPNRDLPAWYQAADAFLMPSYEEGFPRVVLEAMASGLPVVATRAGGTADVLGEDYPMLVETGDVEGLAGRLGTLARDRDLRARLGVQLRDRAVDLFDTEPVTEMLLKHFEEIRQRG